MHQIEIIDLLSKFSSNQMITIFDDKSLYLKLGDNPKNFLYYSKVGSPRLGNKYHDLYDIPFLAGDVLIVSRYSLRSMLYQYPYKAKIILVNISWSLNFIIGITGIIRRVIFSNKRIKNEFSLSVVQLYIGKTKHHKYLCLKNQNQIKDIRIQFDSNISLEMLSEILNRRGIKHVFLPEILYKNIQGDTCRIIVDDKDINGADFINSIPAGDCKLTVMIISRSLPSTNNMLTYFPDSITNLIFNNLDYEIGYPRLKSNIEELVIYYENIFHFGIHSSFKSSIIQTRGLVSHLKKNNLNELSLEDIYFILKELNFIPHSDTQALIATNNLWLRKFLEINKLSIYPDNDNFNVLIYKSKIIEENKLGLLNESLLKLNFDIVVHQQFDFKAKHIAEIALRGGQWQTHNIDSQLLPAGIMIIQDKSIIYKNMLLKSTSFNNIRHKKSKLRKLVDGLGESGLHITDDSNQASEYLQTLYDDSKVLEIKSKLKKHNLERIYTFKSFFPEFTCFFLAIIRYIYQNSLKLFRNLFIWILT